MRWGGRPPLHGVEGQSVQEPREQEPGQELRVRGQGQRPAALSARPLVLWGSHWLAPTRGPGAPCRGRPPRHTGEQSVDLGGLGRDGAGVASEGLGGPGDGLGRVWAVCRCGRLTALSVPRRRPQPRVQEDPGAHRQEAGPGRPRGSRQAGGGGGAAGAHAARDPQPVLQALCFRRPQAHGAVSLRVPPPGPPRPGLG